MTSLKTHSLADSHASFPIFQLFLAVDLFHLKSRLEHSRENMVQRTGGFLPIVGMTFLNKRDILFKGKADHRSVCCMHMLVCLFTFSSFPSCSSTCPFVQFRAIIKLSFTFDSWTQPPQLSLPDTAAMLAVFTYT
jgi:hypothetical protein